MRSDCSRHVELCSLVQRRNCARARFLNRTRHTSRGLQTSVGMWDHPIIAVRYLTASTRAHSAACLMTGPRFRCSYPSSWSPTLSFSLDIHITLFHLDLSFSCQLFCDLSVIYRSRQYIPYAGIYTLIYIYPFDAFHTAVSLQSSPTKPHILESTRTVRPACMVCDSVITTLPVARGNISGLPTVSRCLSGTESNHVFYLSSHYHRYARHTIPMYTIMTKDCTHS